MVDDIAKMRSDLSVTLCKELKEAWEYCYLYLFTSNPDDVQERLETYKIIVDWYDSGVIATTPFFNITMGYTLAKDILPASMLDLGVTEMQDVYLTQGRLAALELLEELEESLNG